MLKTSSQPRTGRYCRSGSVRTDLSEKNWVATDEGAHLRNRRTRNTGPEMKLRSAVHELGLRFRLHRRVVGRCTPDFVLPRWRVAVFVDGCFWHGCPEHSPRQFKGPNKTRWEEKLAANRLRDSRNNRLLVDAGWRVIRIWECEIRTDVDEAAARVAELARGPQAAD
ncbi:very short patch repair endonuclease [Nonomuraea wenchangensis]